jgi:hypothetical protein
MIIKAFSESFLFEKMDLSGKLVSEVQKRKEMAEGSI